MKILHFSDIHIGGWVKSPRGYFDKRLLGSINYMLRRKKYIKWHHFDNCLNIIKNEKPDVVCFTGDLISTSEPFEFQKVQKKMQPLVENESFELLCVPGNHDRYVKNKLSIKLLNETYFYLNRKKFTLEDLPLKKNIKGIDFFLIDESFVMPWTSSNGFIKDDDIKALKLWTQDKKNPNILVSHYPLKNVEGKELPPKRKLKNSQEVYKLLATKTIDIALCGHTHFPFIRQENSGALEICAGSLTINGRMNKLIYEKETQQFKQEWIIC